MSGPERIWLHDSGVSCIDEADHGAYPTNYVRSDMYEYQAATIKELTEALEAMTKHYVDIVNCGDCGSWNPEDELEVKLARALLSKAKAVKP